MVTPIYTLMLFVTQYGVKTFIKSANIWKRKVTVRLLLFILSSILSKKTLLKR
mgnify:CR=1 FL=1